MAMKELSPVNLSAGTTVELNADGSIKTNVLGGQVVKLTKVGTETFLVPSVSTDAVATASPFGFAYTGTVEEPANKLYVPFNQYKGPRNLVSVVLTKGALIQLWDEIGPEPDSAVADSISGHSVFEHDVVNAAPGTLLYVSKNSKLTIDAADDATTVGAVAVAEVVEAPTDAKGVLTVRTLL